MPTTSSRYAAAPLPEYLRGIGILDDVHQHLLAVANDDGKVYTNRDQVAEAIDKNRATTYRALQRLETLGLVDIEWGNRGRRTIITLRPADAPSADDDVANEDSGSNS